MLGSPPEPIARGTLAETPLCHVALYLYRRNSSGTLVIDAGMRTETRIRFARGRPVAARIPFAREGLLACLLPLCGLRAGVFEFFEADLVGEHEEVVQGVVDPYELISASLDEHAREDMVEALLTRFAETKLRIQPGRDLERLRLPARDRALLELIRAAPASPSELIAQAPLPQQRTRRLIYALIATHMVSPHQEREEPGYRSQVDLGVEAGGVPINEVAASGARAWQQLASLRPGANGSMNPGSGNASLRPGAPATSVRPGAAGAPGVRPSSSPISASSGSAPAPRRASLRPPPMPGQSNPSPPPGSQRPVAGAASSPPSLDDHPANVRRVEQLLMRGRSDEALEVLDLLLAVNQCASDLLGLRAQALFEKHRAGDEDAARLVGEAIKRALEVNPDEVRALFTRGLVLKRAGETKKSLAYFRRVVQLSPRHLEAQREVRLAKLREE